MGATSTHDSKRGEDFRARLHVLSEAPAEWSAAAIRWQRLNRPLLREIDGDPVPDANEEYLIYQTLVGTWPRERPTAEAGDVYRDRILQYMRKAIREAKIHASWMNPSDDYEAAIHDFISDLLGEKGREFTAELSAFVARIADAGYVNSLAQLVLKATLPGVPDFYRGTELWDFNLVDPDNRRAVDYESRRGRLKRLRETAQRGNAEAARDVMNRWPDPDAKLWTTAACLTIRRDCSELFTFGEYLPLTVEGEQEDHLISFARRRDEEAAIVVVPRRVQNLMAGDQVERKPGMPRINWQDTRIVVPDDFPSDWECRLSGQQHALKSTGGTRAILASELLDNFPVAVLTLR
jgi:(1->4)-alpha-D-glucan 1-alpha-D-glucosylmutase